MTTPVTSSPSATVQNSSSSSISTTSPAGIGSQPSSITSAAPDETASRGFWGTIKGYASSFAEFIRKISVSALEGIRSGLGVVVGWLGGEAAETEDPGSWDVPAPPPATTQDPFTALTISDIEQQKIYTLIHTMGGSWWTLITKKGELERIGREIDHVHPLKFLDYIFRHPVLPKDMESIGKSSLTWKPFMDGLSSKLQRESATTLPACKTGFARSLNVKLADIDPYLSSSNWEGLVKFLIDVKLKRKNSVFDDPSTHPGTTTTTAPTGSTTTTASTTDAGTSTTPTSSSLLADLPFDTADDAILTSLLTQYAEENRWWLICNHDALVIEWGQLRQQHPLKLLAYIYEKPALINHLQTIARYWGTMGLFTMSLNHRLSQLPLADVNPYVDDFSRICRLDPARTKAILQHGHWNQLIEDLLESHRARGP